MKSYINTLVDYREAPFEREVTIACPEEYLQSQMKHLTRGFKKVEAVNILEKGDIAVLSLESGMEKFNRPSVFVTIGGGLFHEEFEEMLVGHTVGETFEAPVEGSSVKVTVKQASRTVFPEPTDEMAAAYAAEHDDFSEITTVEKYRRYVVDKYLEEKRQEALGEAMETVMEYVLTHSDWEFDEEEVKALSDEFKEEIDQELREENKELGKLSEEELMGYFGVNSREEAERVIVSEAERGIATALWVAALEGKDTKAVSLEELGDYSWEFLENYVKENLTIREER